MSDAIEEIAKTNGTVEAESDLTEDERAFLLSLLSHANVCALLTEQPAKAMAANIQAKLGDVNRG